jgi:tetratricopeptide (TPR) repeat protein
MKKLIYALLLLPLGCSNQSADPQTANEADSRQEKNPSAQEESAVNPKMDLATPSSLTGDKPSASPNPHARLSPEQHIAVALQHAQEGRIDQAVDILNSAIAQTPDHAGLLGARGGLMLSLDQTADALADLEQAVKLAPDSALLLANRSQAYRKFNRLAEAMADLDKAIDLSPNLIPARFNRGVLHYGNADYEKAMIDFDLCIELDEQTAGPYFNRAITRDAMGDSKGAVDDLNRFLSLTDDEAWKQAARDTLRVIEEREAVAKSE